MQPDVAARAFEPFYTTKEIGKGSGLGLSMVYGFAKQSGGAVHLQSAPGAGTSVTLYLPRAQASHVSNSESPDKDVLRHGADSIMVVEDDEEVRDVSVAVLRDAGYRVVVAADGHEALKALQKATQIDLLFTDIVMPGGLSGVALARGAQRAHPGLKVLLTTGYTDLHTVAAQEFPLIRKPFRPTELTELILEILNSTSAGMQPES